MLDDALEQLPYIPRISASRELQMRIEAAATASNQPEVTAALVEQVLATR